MTEIAPVEVSMHIPGTPPEIFRFCTDPARYVQWMGSQADLDPVPGGVYPRAHAGRVPGMPVPSRRARF